MRTRSHHFIAISGGKIEIRLAGDPDDGLPHLFETEAAAAIALAEAMVRTGSVIVMTSSSVDWPEDEGMPDFNFDRLMGLTLDAKGQ